ncbi:MAG: hypothetical protein ABI680_09555 [Chthoniobacteraceae bacterium]
MKHPHFTCALAGFVIAIIKAVPEPIPDLKPPRGEIPPTFWEMHGLAVIGTSLIGLFLLVALIRQWRQPKPVIVETPAEIATRNLQALRDEPNAATVLLRTSETLRRYLIARFGLPGPGLTADEIAIHLHTDPPLARQLHRFMADCDLVKFAPVHEVPASDPIIHDALRLIEAVERRSPPPLPA